MSKPKLLFIHRSVGENLLRDSNFYALAGNNPAYELCDFNQNTGMLRNQNGEVRPVNWGFPGGDTTPADYAKLFSARRLAAHDPMLGEILTYDIIAIKSCFPNTRITSDSMLAAHQQAYEQVVQFFHSQPGKKLVILTSPPLIPVLTLPPFARRARTLAQWLNGTDFGKNIYVFDFFGALAVPEGRPQANTLRREYRRLFPFDSHPNAAAARDIAPKLGDFFARVAEMSHF